MEVLKKTGKYQKSTFALNMISLRESLGLTAEKFAEIADVPYPTIRDIEVGRSGGSPRTRKKIAIALHTSIDALNTPHGEPINGAKPELITSIVADLGRLHETELRAVRSLMDAALSSRRSSTSAG